CNTTVFSACPGVVHVAAVTLLPFNSMSTTVERICPCSPPREITLCARSFFCPNFGLTSAALSQVSLVNGLGNSCSQPLLAKRPSYTVGSGRKMYSTSPAGITLGSGKLAGLNFSSGLIGGNFVPAITPSFSHFRQPASIAVPRCVDTSVQ